MHLFSLTHLWVVANQVIFDIGGLVDLVFIYSMKGWWLVEDTWEYLRVYFKNYYSL